MSGYKSQNLFQVIIELSKVKITFAVAFTTLAGYVLAKGTIDTGIIVPVFGIFFLACGSSVINHIQEKKSDTKMKRTSERPLPSGKITVKQAVIVASIEILAGASMLFFLVGFEAFILGITAMIWYNIVYTNLKKVTVHAVVPGSLIGAIPPMVGWVAAGSSLLSFQAFIIALFFFVWQVPHFYLLAYKYSNDYKSAGFPSLISKYSTFQVKRLIFYWITVTAITAMFIPMFRITTSYITLVAIGILSFRLVIIFIRPIMNQSIDFVPGKYFMKINYYVLTVILLLVFDRIIANIL